MANDREKVHGHPSFNSVKNLSFDSYIDDQNFSPDNPLHKQ